MSDAGAPEAKPESVPLNLTVKDQNGGEMQFKVKSTTKFRKIMDAYCDRSGKEFKACRFMFDGSRLIPEETPQHVEMEDEDSIDVFMEQLGGRRD